MLDNKGFDLWAGGHDKSVGLSNDDNTYPLLALLNEGGIIYIGDVAFQTRKEMDACRGEAGEFWDDEEIYFVYEELKEHLPNLTFEKYSFYSGLLTISN